LSLKLDSGQDDILADDVGLTGEYPVGCLLAVFTGYFLFFFCVRIVHGSDGLRMKDSKWSFDVSMENQHFFRKMDDCDIELNKRAGT
jgi:hypothetical protein